MQGAEVGAFAAEYPFVLLQRQQQGRHRLLQQEVAGRRRAVIEVPGAEVELLDEDASQAPGGIEAIAGIAFGSAQVALECAFRQFENPEVVVGAIVEAVGRVAPFDDETAGAAAQFASVLLEMHVGATRHGDQVEGIVVLADLRLAARVAQLAGAQARQAERGAGRAPALQVAIERLVGGELQAQGEVGIADGLDPARLPFGQRPAVGR
ncbi:hypothetical protein FQZ97_989370 [compost metagenome]